MDMMLTGKNLRPAKALAAGLVDRVVPLEQLRSAAKKWRCARGPGSAHL
jgi:enoyl-CoA hydratase/carnithine racemase